MVRTLALILLILIISASSYTLGYLYKNQDLIKSYGDRIIKTISDTKTPQVVINSPNITVKPQTVASQPIPSKQKVQNWTGPQFWDEISSKRKDNGLHPIPPEELLCTLAAIRLADIRRLGRLDNHDGFKPLADKYKEDLEKADLLNLFEFLTSGAPTAKAAVDGLYDTMGHKALFTEIYKGGCAYAADTFGVVITSK